MTKLHRVKINQKGIVLPTPFQPGSSYPRYAIWNIMFSSLLFLGPWHIWICLNKFSLPMISHQLHSLPIKQSKFIQPKGCNGVIPMMCKSKSGLGLDFDLSPIFIDLTWLDAKPCGLGLDLDLRIAGLAHHWVIHDTKTQFGVNKDPRTC